MDEDNWLQGRRICTLNLLHFVIGDRRRAWRGEGASLSRHTLSCVSWVEIVYLPNETSACGEVSLRRKLKGKHT